jgi:hypothetical protein
MPDTFVTIKLSVAQTNTVLNTLNAGKTQAERDSRQTGGDLKSGERRELSRKAMDLDKIIKLIEGTA